MLPTLRCSLSRLIQSLVRRTPKQLQLSHSTITGLTCTAAAMLVNYVGVRTAGATIIGLLATFLVLLSFVSLARALISDHKLVSIALLASLLVSVLAGAVALNVLVAKDVMAAWSAGREFVELHVKQDSKLREAVERATDLANRHVQSFVTEHFADLRGSLLDGSGRLMAANLLSAVGVNAEMVQEIAPLVQDMLDLSMDAWREYRECTRVGRPLPPGSPQPAAPWYWPFSDATEDEDFLFPVPKMLGGHATWSDLFSFFRIAGRRLATNAQGSFLVSVAQSAARPVLFASLGALGFLTVLLLAAAGHLMNVVSFGINSAFGFVLFLSFTIYLLQKPERPLQAVFSLLPVSQRRRTELLDDLDRNVGTLGHDSGLPVRLAFTIDI